METNMIEWLLTTAPGMGIAFVALLCFVASLLVAYAWGIRDCSRAWTMATGMSQRELERGEFRDELMEFRERIGRLKKDAHPTAG
jgi:hypothetical protein